MLRRILLSFGGEISQILVILLPIRAYKLGPRSTNTSYLNTQMPEKPWLIVYKSLKFKG